MYHLNQVIVVACPLWAEISIRRWMRICKNYLIKKCTESKSTSTDRSNKSSLSSLRRHASLSKNRHRQWLNFWRDSITRLSDSSLISKRGLMKRWQRQKSFFCTYNNLNKPSQWRHLSWKLNLRLMTAQRWASMTVSFRSWENRGSFVSIKKICSLSMISKQFRLSES